MVGFFDGFQMGMDLFWSIATAEPLITWFLIIFAVGAYLFVFIVNTIRDQKLKKSGILQVDTMKGKEFEEYLRVLFSEKGYQVLMTPATGDYGADLVLSQKGRKIIVQAKRYKKNVGIKAVQEISSAKMHYKADECWVVTNNGYTEPARRLAKSNQVRLVDRTLLMKWMLEIQKENRKSPEVVDSKSENKVIHKG